jgi:hypothetical protein
LVILTGGDRSLYDEAMPGLEKMGRKDDAAVQFKKVVALAPDTPEAQRAKQQLDSGSGRSGS